MNYHLSDYYRDSLIPSLGLDYDCLLPARFRQPRRTYSTQELNDAVLEYKGLYEAEKEKNRRLQSKDWRFDVDSIKDMFVLFVRVGTVSRVLLVRDTDYVRDVKRQYAIWWQTSSDVMLQFGDVILEDNKTLAECGITTYARVTIVTDYQEPESAAVETKPVPADVNPSEPKSASDEVTQLEAQVKTLENRNRELEELINKFSVICVNCKMMQ